MSIGLLLARLELAITAQAHAIYQETRSRPSAYAAEICWMVDYERRFNRLPAEHRELIVLAAQGLTQAEVAAIHRCSLRTMSRKYQEYGIRTMPKSHAGGRDSGRRPGQKVEKTL